MPTMKPLLAIGLCSLFVFGKCNKDDEPSPSDNFQPTKAGSIWNYTTTNLGAGGGTANFTLTATAKDSTISSRSYRVFSNSAGSNEYYTRSGSDYYQFGRFEAIGDNIELLYLKSATAGTTWEENRSVSISGVSIPVKFTFTLAQKGIGYSVAGKSYTGVSRVNCVLSATGVPISAQAINFYYADGVGRIQSNVQLVIPLASINSNFRTDLTSYTLAP